MGREKPQIPALPIYFVADLIGVSERRVSQLIEASTLTKAGPSLVTGESFAAYMREERAAKATANVDAELQAAKLRKALADAELAEFQVAKEARAILPARPVERTWSTAIRGAMTRLLSLPARLGPQVVIAPSAQAATDLMDKEMRQALNELADAGPEIDAQS